jgi:UPF0271 protein
MVEIDINVDAGESYGHWPLGDDAAMFDVVTSANLACGFHAGDPGTMRRAVERAVAAGVVIGAHPGLPDRVGFGRRAMALTPQEAYDDVLYQHGALDAFVRVAGASIGYVKPHGALNTHVAERDPAVADAIVRAVASIGRTLPLVVIAGSALARSAERLGHPAVAEGFPDRGYLADGRLAPRSEDGAVVGEAVTAAARAVRMVVEGTVVAVDGTVVPLAVRTLCVHGDHPGALETARAIRGALETAGVTIAAFRR